MHIASATYSLDAGERAHDLSWFRYRRGHIGSLGFGGAHHRSPKHPTWWYCLYAAFSSPQMPVSVKGRSRGLSGQFPRGHLVSNQLVGYLSDTISCGLPFAGRAFIETMGAVPRRTTYGSAACKWMLRAKRVVPSRIRCPWAAHSIECQ